jgi:hypothetical protein
VKEGREGGRRQESFGCKAAVATCAPLSPLSGASPGPIAPSPCAHSASAGSGWCCRRTTTTAAFVARALVRPLASPLFLN